MEPVPLPRRRVCALSTCKRLLAFGTARPRLWERVSYSGDVLAALGEEFLEEERVGEVAAWLIPRRHLVKTIKLSFLRWPSMSCLLGALAGAALEELAMSACVTPVNLGLIHLPRLRKLSITMIEIDDDEEEDHTELEGSCSRLPALHNLRVRSLYAYTVVLQVLSCQQCTCAYTWRSRETKNIGQLVLCG